jgi:HEAT repeat protein
MKDKSAPAALRAACAKAQLVNDPDYFMTGIRDECPMVKATLVRHADEVPDTVLVAAMAKACPEGQAAIITKLAAKNSKASAPAIAKMLSSEKPEVVGAALKALCKIGTAANVPAMFTKLSDPDNEIKKAASMALNDLLCKESSAKLIEIAGSDIEKQKAVLKILAERTRADDISKMAAFLKSDDASVRKEAWKAIGKTANEKSYKQLITCLAIVQDSDVNQAESAIRSSIRNVNPEQRKTELLKAWGSASAAAKVTLINLMAQYSDDAYIPVISKAMSDTNTTVANSAIRTLGGWSNIKPYAELVKTLKEQSDAKLKKTAYRSALKLAMAKGGKNADKMCSDLFKNAPSDKDRETLTTLYFKENTIDTFTLLKNCFNDAGCGAASKKLYVKLYDEQLKGNNAIGAGELAPKAWKVNASHNGRDAKLAIDRNDGSRWTSGGSQKGMWFTIDLGSKTFISQILLDTTRSGNDTPNGCEVFVSDDDKNWGNPVAKADGKSQKKTVIKMSATGRHIKIVTTGKRPGLHWSIHEIYIKAGMDQNLIKEIKATADSLR